MVHHHHHHHYQLWPSGHLGAERGLVEHRPTVAQSVGGKRSLQTIRRQPESEEAEKPSSVWENSSFGWCPDLGQTDCAFICNLLAPGSYRDKIVTHLWQSQNMPHKRRKLIPYNFETQNLSSVAMTAFFFLDSVGWALHAFCRQRHTSH